MIQNSAAPLGQRFHALRMEGMEASASGLSVEKLGERHQTRHAGFQFRDAWGSRAKSIFYAAAGTPSESRCFSSIYLLIP